METSRNPTGNEATLHPIQSYDGPREHEIVSEEILRQVDVYLERFTALDDGAWAKSAY